MELIQSGAKSLYVLDPDSSLNLLSSSKLGRVAVNGEQSPLIFPVQYAVDGEAVVFRAGADLRNAIDGRSAVTFQADGYDDDRDAAWNIVAEGPVEQMRDLGQLEVPVGFTAAQTTAWAREQSHWMRVVPNVIVGVLSTGDVLDITD